MTSDRTDAPNAESPGDQGPVNGDTISQTDERPTGAPAGEATTDSKADEYLRMAQRAQADLINFRRRVDQEREELRGTTRVETLQALLPVLDDFERATAAIPEESRSLPWVQGILLIERNLRAVIERAGFERIDAQGKPFDPWEHEAIMTDSSGQHEEDTVTAVVRPGYRVGGRVLRPAQVVVARGS